jgi:hypothetical protein
VALIQIRAHRPGRYLIVTDNMISSKTLQTRKKACWWSKNNGYEIYMIWIPSNAGVVGNERADQFTHDAVENGIDCYAPVTHSDFLLLSWVKLLEGWQNGLNGSDILALFGLWFHFCLGLSVLTAT